MIYNKKIKAKKNDKLIQLFVIILILFLIFFTGLNNMFRKLVVSVFGPINESASYVDDYLTGAELYASSKKSLISVIGSQRKEINDLSLELLDLRSVVNSFSPIYEEEGVIASGKIIRLPNQSISGYITTNLGEKSGIQKGDVLTLGGIIYLGEVEEILKSYSLIRPIDLPNRESQAYIEAKENIPITLVGQGSGSFTAVSPRDTDVGVGMHVLSNENKIIGIVSEVQFESQNPIKRILISSPVNISAVKTITVVRPLLN